jgi:crotonobetainyl-CoA:carnitine CoA-transferase CaiB-like acyl-CoA transferase
VYLRFATPNDRIEQVNVLEKCIEEVLIEKETQYWVEKMDENGVPGGPIYTYDQTLNDPHILARGMVQEFEHPKAGRMKTLGIPAKMSGTPGQISKSAPQLGQHTEEVLRQYLDFPLEEIENLRNENVI